MSQLRARDLFIPFVGVTGKYNAITDVSGVEVGYCTVQSVSNSIRTGVTAVLPRGRVNDPVYANWHALNGNGEMTGTTWITESGFLETPILITNSNSVGVVRDAVLEWFVQRKWYKETNWYTYPVVAETYDGILNDICSFSVTKEHAFDALNNATTGEVKEGNAGGGTGMISFGFKSGTGTSSRCLTVNGTTYTVGVLVQANMGIRKNLTIAGMPLGKELIDLLNPEINTTRNLDQGEGSIITIIATDAPLLPHQLKRLAMRATIGVGKVGGMGENGSGDIFLAFSTANSNTFNRQKNTYIEQLPNDLMNPLFEGTIQATEEAIINSMIAAETMTGFMGNTIHAIPHSVIKQGMEKYKNG